MVRSIRRLATDCARCQGSINQRREGEIGSVVVGCCDVYEQSEMNPLAFGSWSPPASPSLTCASPQAMVALMFPDLSMLIVDDRDPAVRYDPLDAWTFAGSSSDYSGTRSGGSGVMGASATYIFYGTNVAVWGSLEPLDIATSAVYQIDKLEPDVLTQGSNCHGPLLYQSPVLELGQHTLTIRPMVEGSELWLDYFTHMPSDTLVSLSPRDDLVATSGSSTASTPTHASTIGVSTHAATPAAPPRPTTTARSSSVPVGAIAGRQRAPGAFASWNPL
ncbi:hypothetical protein BC834DRAFT_141400 [Gloeopeniophorella convolvens]|nr:hypothetical protein BC834DRAFT_141400 [Gloeopeniophorella convolvens]